MKFYEEAARRIPVIAETDVLVAGGGPAGIGAALAAARCGAKVMLIEKGSALGGVATLGMMSHWSGAAQCPLMNEIAERSVQSSSMPLELASQLDGFDRSRGIPHECLKQTLSQMMRESGVVFQLHTMAVGVICENNKVRGIITESKSGREAIYAKAVIDATGDGDIAAFAGVEYQQGREEDHQCQPVTTMFRIGGVDYSRAVFPGSFETLIHLPKGEIQALGKAHLPAPAGHVLLYRNSLPGEVVVNMTNVTGIDGTNVRDLTRAEIICRDQMDAIVKFLREYVPGYEKCYLTASGEVGVRETRHFKGVYTLVPEDIVEAMVFDDWIATRNFFNFDIHNLSGSGLDANGCQKHFKAKGEYTIPYRACVPEKIDGLLLSGRNISGTHKASSNYRVMGICLNIGQGVGTAAAVAVRDNVELRNANIRKVQDILLKTGVEV